jgi:hypothetical protein
VADLHFERAIKFAAFDKADNFGCVLFFRNDYATKDDVVRRSIPDATGPRLLRDAAKK